ncbi:putative transcription factor interactor and regulator CCHC(Zn) family [Helianthus annuus]|uniref:Transcription factor interactor and regulator CCHC(Zn) family n=1 Tax=Helianthus annuus TaxID=4232 RepID=A0A9K3DFG9_HELAN|nr:putative transcription factor interactor and regulator CCHC(Zn) family [Helianthus annuus]KAJ0631051.1 putative transcription factor interactor and regulator CCHC(Zn) family [Helianthus annuus]KAJ0634931.1 putative transcription factor interactor and regulator CCHC(Zn) family [Helianthus annuus]KAJ0811554.1 putative transcription factor interactor and regulator CCHC(Zn) family [Helianthus annuus]KAJ0824634.1 putative transcription factor interactor and regulator CCHC(Zn) family [Helianthus a
MYVCKFEEVCLMDCVGFEWWLFPPNSTVPPTVSPPNVFKSFAGNSLGTKTIITVSNCPHLSHRRLSNFQSILKLFTDIMNTNSCDDSAVSSSGGQHSGIRATDYSNLRATSTTIPCQHCADEKRGRRWLVKRCYYCNNPGHQVSNCKRKESDEETQLIRLAINTGVQQRDVKNEEHRRSWEPEFIVTRTDGGLWSEIWYVSKSLKNHFSGNLNMFKRIKSMKGVESNTGENQFYFIRGIGVTEVILGIERIRIQSVFYSQDIDRNVLSYDQLITQGFTVKFSGDKCKLYPTFSVPLINGIDAKSGLTKEEEMGILEKQKVMNKEEEFMAFKNDYLNSYFEKLEISSNEPDWNVMILQILKFKDFLDCKALLDMMDDEEYIGKYKYILQTKFEEMVEWFMIKKLGITTRPLPAYASNNRKVFLLDLYLEIEKEGGHRSVTENNLWPKVAKDMGFEYSGGELMRLIYVMYLDVLVYYYKFKIVQSGVSERDNADDKEVKGIMQMIRKCWNLRWICGAAAVKEKTSRMT